MCSNRPREGTVEQSQYLHAECIYHIPITNYRRISKLCTVLELLFFDSIFVFMMSVTMSEGVVLLP